MIVLPYYTHHVHYKNNRSVLLCTHTTVDKPDPKNKKIPTDDELIFPKNTYNVIIG